MLRLNDSVTLHVDVAEWMRESGRFDRIRSTDREWIQATCPFHDDRHPSFAVSAETGAYRCLACGAAGSFVALVRHIEGNDDAESDLIARYGRFVPDVDEPLELDFGEEEERFVAIESYVGAVSEWLEVKRGISKETQVRFDVCDMNNQIVMPWFDAKGRCVTIKYRSIAEKTFWYDPPVTPGRLKRLLYGFHLARDADLIVVCEGEIDAMSIVQSGFAAVALGGASISEAQASLLRNAKATEIVIFTDNDGAGRIVATKINDALSGHKRISAIDWSLFNDAKDANDILCLHGEAHIQTAIQKRVPVDLLLGRH